MTLRIPFRIVRLLAASLLLGAAAPLAHAQARPTPGAVDGVVTDTGLVALADATASILGTSLQVVTGANGRFRILGLRPGQYILAVRRLGFAPSSAAPSVAPGDTVRMAFTLNRVVTALDTVVVATKRHSMRLAEFEDRRKLGFGHFVTQPEIDKRNAVLVTDLLHGIPSVRAVAGGAATNDRYHGCVFQLFLDGVAQPSGTKLDDRLTPQQIAGIEVYSGPAIIPPAVQDYARRVVRSHSRVDEGRVVTRRDSPA